MQRIRIVIVAVAFVTALSGCVIALGNRDYPPPKEVRPTVGQQLIDLKKAREAGAISDQEYEAQRTRLLGSKPAN
jgi:hypothetical protein